MRYLTTVGASVFALTPILVTYIGYINPDSSSRVGNAAFPPWPRGRRYRPPNPKGFGYRTLTASDEPNPVGRGTRMYRTPPPTAG